MGRADYDRYAHLGHSTARARDDAATAEQRARERREQERREQERRLADQFRPSAWSSSTAPPRPAPSSGTPRASWQPTVPRVVSYPTAEEGCGGRHPAVHGLHTDLRSHPRTGEPVLEVMWTGVLPEAREFVPLSAVRRRWSGLTSQGVAVPLEVRREGDGFRVRWTAPAPTKQLRERREVKTMLGLDGADRRPTFVLRPAAAVGQGAGVRADGSPPGAQVVAAALVAGAGAALGWWLDRRRGGR